MILPGHVAAAVLAASGLHANLRGSLAASMFPDLVDKPLRWLWHVTPNDRIPAHSLLGCVLSTLGAWTLGGRSFGRGWLVGYGAHLACDELNAHLNPGRIYFWWPFRRYTMHRGPTGLSSSLNDFSPASVMVEAAITALGLWFWCARRRPG